MAALWSVAFFSTLVVIATGSNTEINCCANTDQESCKKLYPTDCQDVRDTQGECSGIYMIYIGRHRQPVRVYCEMERDVSWTVFQRRIDGDQDFLLDWVRYKEGFGELYGEFWLGNKYLHLLTDQRNYTLRIDLESFENERRYAEYSSFHVEGRVNKYRLTVDGYSGNAGDAMLEGNNQYFSTKDQDNDIRSGSSCAARYRGAWWYSDCHQANLNGMYLAGEHNSSYADGVNWRPWKGYFYSLKFTEMKLARN